MSFEGIPEGPDKKRKVLWSMVILAVVVVGAGVATKLATDSLRTNDPIYQCIDDPLSAPYQLSVRIAVTENGVPSLVPRGIGITEQCTLPVHTLEEGVIHVAYSEPYKFTLGHFLFNWKIDLTKFDTTVYLNGQKYEATHFLDLPLKDGDSIRVDFVSRK